MSRNILTSLFCLLGISLLVSSIYFMDYSPEARACKALGGLWWPEDGKCGRFVFKEAQ